MFSQNLEKVQWSIERPTQFIINCRLWNQDENENTQIDNSSSSSFRLTSKFDTQFLLKTEKNEEVLKLKNNFDHIPKYFRHGKYSLFTNLRNLSNPYEMIGNLNLGQTKNRSASKFMEINFIMKDYLKNFFTVHQHNPNENASEAKSTKKMMNIFDLCVGSIGDVAGAPHGFTEFCFSHLKQLNYPHSCHSTIVNLYSQGQSKFSRNSLNINNIQRNHNHNQNDNDNNERKFKFLFNDDNDDKKSKNNDITDRNVFQAIVRESEISGKYDLIFADGGFSVEGDENNQEIRHTHLILAELLIGILASKQGGNFIIKIFDQQSNLSKYLTLLTAQFFENFSIHKLCQSRPANTERYIIFSNRLDPSNKNDNNNNKLKSIIQWMLTLYIGLCENSDSETQRKREIIKNENSKNNDKFYGFGGNSNNGFRGVNENTYTIITIDILENILNYMQSNSINFPLENLINDLKIQNQWRYIQQSQTQSEIIQTEYLTILNEMLQIFIVNPVIMENNQIIRNLNVKFNIINLKNKCANNNDDNGDNQKILFGGKDIAEMKIKEWVVKVN